ncbi:MAG: 2-isopropylmalate synthase, partial [Pseudomonadota bacterium]
MGTKTSLLAATIIATGFAFGAYAQDAATGEQAIYEDTGGVYEGEFKDGLQHGQGTYRLPNGYEYTGNWVDGRIEGQGTARFPN